MLNTPPTYTVTVHESGCKVARLPAYSLIWLSDRRCSGPVCSSTAHLGKSDQFWAVLIQNPPPPPPTWPQNATWAKKPPTAKSTTADSDSIRAAASRLPGRSKPSNRRTVDANRRLGRDA